MNVVAICHFLNSNCTAKQNLSLTRFKIKYIFRHNPPSREKLVQNITAL